MIHFGCTNRPGFTALISSAAVLAFMLCIGHAQSIIPTSTAAFHPGELWYDT